MVISPVIAISLRICCFLSADTLPVTIVTPADDPSFGTPIYVASTEHPGQWVRNPMYIAVLSVIIGEAILFRSLLLVEYALLVWLVVHLFVVFVEEPSLRSQFGASYETYLSTVRRWLPRPPRT